jgi:hypothetical protein
LVTVDGAASVVGVRWIEKIKVIQRSFASLGFVESIRTSRMSKQRSSKKPRVNDETNQHETINELKMIDQLETLRSQ